MHWADISRRQAGVLSRSQLLAAGVGRVRIDELIRRGRLGATRWSAVYLAAGAPMTPEAVQWAVVLDTASVLSYVSAAQWWALPVGSDGRVHVTAPDRRRTRMPSGVRVHRVQLAASAVTERFGMPITTRTETLLDCVGWLPLREGSTLLDRSMQQRWLTARDVEQRLEEQPGRWGNRPLSTLLRQSGDGAHAESERRMIRILRAAGLTGWGVNVAVTVAGSRFVLDFAFVAARIAIEVDGWAFHSDVDRFRADRRKGNALVADGWTLLRFTWADLFDDSSRVVATIVALLAQAQG
ncbi:very-short-patch-repair endonuclease [Jatrophihabitans sp. GAS493]|uniref:DUF559 domain-containing protein n=1 Tax=Jatrophihabitans sp. GAS493 TaxID=1907575 RepID=UPI000BB9326D|nr:DUF559 domain-containing protein [Jatrophihabitans sp. GAS493]SOD71864.1 very-short-patch-repair endonuclease [Jatrophihabitans sp. GAS493]